MIALSIIGGLLLLIAGISLISSLAMMAFDIGGLFSEWPMRLMGVFLSSAILGIVLLLPVVANHQDSLIKECMQDHKRYECEAMLNRRGGDVAVVPVVVPVR